ncbi:MAG: glycosyltransferase family 9 protein [Acidobacteria bacterium]|nr:glycosyltransferase family 9 protein [Acidobacteriota bacterium]
MNNQLFRERLQKRLFHLSGVLTARFPRVGSTVLDSTLVPLLGHPLLIWHSHRHNLALLKGVREFRRIIVLADIHIGDAVMMQASVSALRDFFPDAEIDYVVKKGVVSLIEGNPEITRIIPLYTGSPLPADRDRQGVRDIIDNGAYDVCFNFSPFFDGPSLFPPGLTVIHFLSHGSALVHNEFHPVAPNHFLYQAYSFIHELLSPLFRSRRDEPFTGVTLHLSDAAVDEAECFIRDIGIARNSPVLFLNPDAASPYTRLPFERQVELLSQLSTLTIPILLAAGHSEANVGVRLKDALPVEQQRGIHVIPPTMPLDAWSALVDCSDAFVSADTGPLHLGAARKCSKSGSRTFRNRTAIYGVFGATPARMSGYDSNLPGFLPANQDGPSHTYVAGSPCRNITCLNKLYKTCKTVRCFEELHIDAIVSTIRAEIATSRHT